MTMKLCRLFFYFIVPVWLLKRKNKQQIQHLENKIANQEEITKKIVEKVENAGKEKEADVEVKITSIKKEIEVDVCEVKDESLEKTCHNPSVGFECEKCEFVAKSKSGLKTHTKKKQ